MRARAKFMIDSAGHYARPDDAHLVLHDPASRTVQRAEEKEAVEDV